MHDGNAPAAIGGGSRSGCVCRYETGSGLEAGLDLEVDAEVHAVDGGGGFGSLGQALDLGSTTIKMDGGIGVIADLLKSGVGSSMLSAAIS
ncbi:hypothetical protein [Rhodococcus sp. RD6.2]|uniref:hypothetical protein n=1 Tax=Rhodococcus sp. RD6.2 TaxID=260936 RepID=UPI0006797514|nr:hypothetical protein [Rhodococcus sp. RD6.2]